MFKNMTKVLTLALVVVMMLSMTSCAWLENLIGGGKPPVNPVEPCTKHVDANGDQVCDNEGCGMALNYTYNTYTSTFGSSWNPHTYQTNNDSVVLDYTTVGFYTFDYNETKDGFVVVPEMAAEMPVDVTSNYVGEEWGIGEDETARAWLIELRDDLTWEDGTPITAYDFVESARRLLDPVAINYRADQLYSGDNALVNAKNRFYSGREATFTATDVYSVYSADLDSELTFTLAAPSDATNGAECAMRTMMGFPASYNAASCAAYLINNYLAGSAFTAEAAAAMENKTLAEIKADPALAAAWADLIGWWQTEPNEELHFFLAKDTFPVTEFEEVGIRALSDTELVIIMESPLEGFYLHYSLTGNFGLVKTDLYDSCASVDENGLYSNTYGTSKETYIGFGPYKLESYQLDKQLVFVRNENWYGYSDPAHEGQYQTTSVVIDKIDNVDTAFQAFLQGQILSIGLDVDHIKDYTSSERIYYTDGDSTWFIAMNPSEEAFAAWEKNNPGKDKSILAMKEFRMAISFSLNRQEFINALDPMGSIGLALFNNMICSDPENGVMYRTEESAKDTILEFWGVSQDDIGEGKLYPTKDEAIASITGYNLEGAKELFNQAYDAAVAEGVYNGTDVIEICIGTPNATSKFYTTGYDFLVNNYTEAVKGTKLEGKLTFTNDNTLNNGFADALRANTVDMLFGVGWTGSALNPYGLIGAYTYKSYQYDPSWDTSTAMMTFTTDDGKTYETSVLYWTYAIEGEEVPVFNVETEEVEYFSCGTADNKPAERVRLLAAIEGAVLRNYDMIPTHCEASASLLSYKVNYGTEDYVYGVGRGGIQYMTYNYTDAEWTEFVASKGGVLNYQ